VHLRVGAICFLMLCAVAAAGYRFIERAPLNQQQLAQRQCIDDVANSAGDNDQGDAVEAQIAACDVGSV
jgi:hypothetical protein